MSPSNNLTLIHQKTEARLRQIAGHSRGALGFCVIDLVSQERFTLNEHNVFPQASAIKIPVLMEVFKQASEDKFKLTEVRRIERRDQTSGSGILSELGDGTTQMSLHDLCVLMIVLSDNTATNILIDLVGMEKVNATLQSLGCKQTRLQRRMMDLDARARGDENLSSPAEAARLMEILHRGEFVSRAVCDGVLEVLKKPKPGALSSGLPTGTVMASKSGSIAGVATEWAIILLADRPYVVVVMENYGIEPDAATARKEISTVLYEYFFRLSRATPHGAYPSPTIHEPA